MHTIRRVQKARSGLKLEHKKLEFWNPLYIRIWLNLRKTVRSHSI